MAPGGRRGERGHRRARGGGARARAGGLTGALTGTQAALVARARGYPWHATAPAAAPEADVRAAIRAGAVALLAYGSNASPEVLRRKLGPRAGAVLASPTALADTDVVYSAHVSPHGAIPATLQPSPGTEVGAWLLAIPPDAIAALDATEPNYVRAPHGDAQVYVSRHGALLLDGAPVALAAIPARGRALAALGEAELLEQVRLRLSPEEDPDRFVLAHVADERVRRMRSSALRAGL